MNKKLQAELDPLQMVLKRRTFIYDTKYQVMFGNDMQKNKIYSFGPHIHRIGISRPAICMKSRSESNGKGPET